MSRANILLLTTRTGGGHLNLAQALTEQLSSKYDVTITDPYPTIIHHYYSTLSRHFLSLWQLQYVWTDNRVGSRLLHSSLTLLNKHRIRDVIEHVQPQLIISTHSLLSYELARANDFHARGGKKQKIPLVFQLTDLEEVHTTWFTEKHADAYLAPSREIYAQALQHGITPGRLHTTGRPVRKQFLDVSLSTRAETLTGLGLDPTIFTIFLQGGAKGSAGIDQTVRCILGGTVPIQIILAVGNNRTLAAHFSGIERLAVLPFTEKIAPYMAAADIIAGKAGASFLTEAFILEKPFVVTTFIPGQEEPSLRFLQRYNLGWVCLDAAEQQDLVTALACNPALIAEKVSSIRAYKEWNLQANRTVPAIIDSLIAP